MHARTLYASRMNLLLRDTLHIELPRCTQVHIEVVTEVSLTIISI